MNYEYSKLQILKILVYLTSLLLITSNTNAQNKSSKKSLTQSDSSGLQTRSTSHSKLDYTNNVLNLGLESIDINNLIGNINEVKHHDFRQGRLDDPIQAIQGYLPGLNIFKNGGDPNSSFDVNIRGRNTFFGNIEPLIVVDGLIGVDVNLLDVNSIQNITVLQDLASTAIYGLRGSNGVILIQTKNGQSLNQSKRPKVTYSSFVSVDQVARNHRLLSAKQYRTLNTDKSSFEDNGANTDWLGALYRTSISHNQNIALSQNKGNMTYHVSYTFNELNGVMKNSNRQRHIIQTALQKQLLDNRVTFSFSGSGTWQKRASNGYDNEQHLDNMLHQAIRQRPTDPIYNEDGTYFNSDHLFQNHNPVQLLDYTTRLALENQFWGNLGSKFNLTHNLSLNASAGGSIIGSKTFATDLNSYDRSKTLPVRQDVIQRNYNYTSAYLNFTKNFGYHSITSSAGHTWEGRFTDVEKSISSAQDPGLIEANDLVAVQQLNYEQQNGFTDDSDGLNSFFSRVNYTYRTKYLVNVNYRHDRSIKFSTTPTVGNFFGVSAGWNMHNEKWMEHVAFFKRLKPWVSYGSTGANEVPEFVYIQEYTSTSYVDPETGEVRWRRVPSSSFPVQNPNFETSREWNIGLDFSLFQDKITGRFNYFSQETNDVYFSIGVPSPPHPFGSRFIQTLAIHNSGFTFNLSSNIINKPDLNWTSSANLMTPQQSVLIPGRFNEIRSGYVTGRGLVGAQTYTQYTEDGNAFGQFYLPQFLGVSDDGASLYSTENGGVTRDINRAARNRVGNSLPKVITGIQNKFMYKRVDVMLSVRGVLGHSVYNANRLLYANSNEATFANVLESAINGQDEIRKDAWKTNDDFYLEKADYINLDYISLGYAILESEKNRIERLRIYLSSNNPLIWSKYTGLNSEQNFSQLETGIESFNTYTSYRNIALGLQVSF